MNYVEIAAQYADDVINDDIPVCLYVKQACQRFISDLERWQSGDWEYYLDVDEANRWCRFLEKLPHVKGRWASHHELFKLSPWQIFCDVNIYGWRHNATGLRRFREAYIEVPRKNGKSFWTSGKGIGHLTIDNEAGAEIYCGASSEKQAWEIFRPARQICERVPELVEKFGVTVNAKSLSVVKTGSKFEPIIGNPGDGSSPSFAIADEFHEHPTSDQVDTMVTGMGAREQPLMQYITTAGADMGGPCYEKRLDVIAILAGTVEDERVFGIIYTLDDGDDWNTIEAQIKANPNYDISVSADFLAGQLHQARRSALKQVAYKTKHLNMWVGARAAWMNMLALQACRKKKLKLDDQKGRECIVGLDLASKVDISSMAILFMPDENVSKYRAFVRHYLPESALEQGPNANRYRAWHADGWLTVTPGNVTDYTYIEDDLKSMVGKFEITEVPYDPFQATQFASHMLEEDFPMIEYGQTVKNLSEPMKQLEAEILTKNIEFEFDPVLFWMFGNVVAKLDAKDNIFPRKEREQNKIDGVVALIIAMARSMVRQETNPYDRRGIMTVQAT